MTTIGSTTSTTPTTTTTDPTTTTTDPTTTTPPGSSLIQTTNGAGAQSIGGLATGLDTNAIIAALVASERALEDPIKNQASLDQVALQSYTLIRQNLATLTTATNALSQPSGWQALLAQSSNTAVATVTAGSGNFSGTLSFNVDALASAGSVRSTNVMTGTTTDIAAGNALFVAAGGRALGFSTFKSDNVLALGSHTITVSQASSAAVKSGGSALAGSTTIDGTNDTLQLSINGTPTTLTLAHGTYTGTQLAQAVQSAASSAGAPVSATLNGAGTLVLSTTRQGSAATLQITGGDALSALSLSTDGAALTGSDGVVQVDGGADQTFSSLDAGSSITLNAGTGTITAVLAAGLTTGTVTGSNVSTGDGSLATVVGNINGANAGVTATAVQVGLNTYRLQLTSNTAGADNGENIDASAFNNNVGGFLTLTAAADAQVTVGSGAGSYTVNSSSNSLTGLLPGVTVTLLQQSTDPVTVTVSHDDQTIADNVQALIDAANAVQTTIAGLTKYDPTSNTAGPLTGDATTTQLIGALTNAVIAVVPGANPNTPGLAGVSIDGTGAFTFNRAEFLAAYDANPQGVTSLFAQGGTATNGGVQFVSAGDRAVAGTYDVNVTQVATQATATGLTGAFPPATLPTVQVSVGSTQVSYAVKGGDTLDDVANGLNSAFASAGFQLQATNTGSGIQITANQYGSSSTFSVDWGDGNGSTAFAGTDIQGTINGVAATGSGQQLMVPFSDNTLSGLALKITTNTTGDMGTFTYAPGLAQRVQTAITSATDPLTGYITASEADLNARITFINTQIASMEVHVAAYETNLRQQYATLESTISSLKTQSAFLTSQINSFGGGSSSSSGG
jgi:flagellar hook-associated protein 2